jgi:hypothetical protein
MRSLFEAWSPIHIYPSLGKPGDEEYWRDAGLGRRTADGENMSRQIMFTIAYGCFAIY